jgi:crotonobetainyl-CoA:carnitine CoA-transferase CaiB-like acyl-CoA transferase
VSGASALLSGFTVLDFSRVLAGPYCTRLLADLGARVIKVERPGVGDDTRRGFLQLEPGREDQSTYFVRINAGKRSIAVDLGHPAGREVALDLARAADVVVENFAPGVMTRLGLDHAALAAVRPGLVYCSISGFGQTGPLRERPAFAHIIQSVSGLMQLEQGGEPPRVLYLQAADVLAGTHAFGAILAALLRRGKTGEGAYLDVSMLETLVAAEDLTFGSLLNGGEDVPGPRKGMIVHAIGGRYVTMQTVGAPDLWARATTAMGRPELAEDPRFASPAGRRDNWDALCALIGTWLDGFASADEALAAMTAARIPCAPVLSPAEVIAHPHLAARGGFPGIPHPARGTVRVTRTPFQVDGDPVDPAGAAPYRAGEHTREVLAELLGYAPDRIDDLLKRGAVAAPAGPASHAPA